MGLITEGVQRSIRISSAALYLVLTLVSIPISFKIGGLQCGLSFTVTLFNLYLISTTLSVLARRSCNRGYVFATSILYYSQHLVIAPLLFLFLSGFSNEEFNRFLSSVGSYQELDPDGSFLDLLKHRILMATTAENSKNWTLYYYYFKFIVQPWQWLLSYSTPFFTLLEGFFTILAIQAIGETNKWLSYEMNSNTWIITSLLVSGGVITGSLYYLYRIYVTPIWKLTIQSASLLGFVLSIVFCLGLYGIISRKGSVIESSLFFAYIVRCIYEISPKLATRATEEILDLVKDVWQTHQRNLLNRDNLLAYYHNVVLKNAEMVWESFILPRSRSLNAMEKIRFWLDVTPVWKFFKNFTVSVPSSIVELVSVTYKVASESLSPAVIVNLCFRILIFYSATRIIPALQRSSYKEQRQSRRILKLLYWYSPCVLIAMYTHLILQYSGELKRELCLWGCTSNWFGSKDQPRIVTDSWSFWNWCNIFWTVLVYANELIGTQAPNELT